MSIALAIVVAVPLLLGLVVVRKLQRDIRERRSLKHRARLHDALLHGGDPGGIVLAAACGARHAQTDLLGTLGRCSGSGVSVLPAVKRADAGRAVAHLRTGLDARDAAARARAALLGGRLGLHALTPDLIERLGDRDADVRLAACAALSDLGTDAAAAGLVAALARDDIRPLRVIERLGRPWAVGVLLAALEGDPPTTPSLARALGLAGDARAVGPLAAALGRGDVEARTSAARALGELGGGAVVDPLLAALGDEAWEVRAQAAKGFATVPAMRAVPCLERALGDTNWWVRTNAATALGRAGAAGLDALERVAAGTDRFAAERAREALQLAAQPRLEVVRA